MSRLLKDWIGEYIRTVGSIAESPEQYHFWSAATIVASAMKRHCWVNRGTYRLFPNTYCVLVGRPGIGKGSALMPAVNLLKQSKAAHFLSGRITIEWILEKMSDGFDGPMPSSNGNGSMVIGHESSLLVFSPEFNVFVSASQHSLKILTDLWDSKEGVWDYGTRHTGEYPIKDPCLNMLAGCTQTDLIDLLPNSSVGGGFTRRVNFVFANDPDQLIPWPEEFIENEALAKDLCQIAMLQGKFKWEDGVQQRFTDYYMKTRGRSEEFADEATAGYNTTMYAHAIKLAMILSASRGDDLTITHGDWTEATTRIDECGRTVKRVFRAVGSSNMRLAADRVIHFIERRGLATRQDILAANWQHMTNQDFDVVMGTLVACGLISEMYSGTKLLYKVTNPGE